jgi:hypothetical protein
MTLKQFFVALFACVALSQVGLRCAHAETAYDITLEDAYGNPLPAFAHRGTRYAMGENGERYNIRIHNRTGQRVEAVVTVDGRDVVSGRVGDYKQERGYILPAWGSVLIEGFRTSHAEVASFRFSAPGDSYSARMGTPENVGVIGAAFFPEASPRPRPRIPLPVAPYPESREGPRRENSGMGTGSSAPAAADAAAKPRRSAAQKSANAPVLEYEGDSESASNIGTEYGESRDSYVSEVHFRRARQSSPAEIAIVRYDDEAGLRARGIDTRPWERQPRVSSAPPSAFPLNRFAPPPPRRY